MKFIPRQLDENVNVSKTHPLVELAWLLGGVLLILAVLYLVLGFSAEFAATRIPVKAELWLGERALAGFPASESPALQQRLEPLLQALPADSPLHAYPFSVHLVETDDVNAAALPGGRILVFAGLIAQTESENELAMVLAHELGHYANRDHLKGLGRGLGVSLATLMIFGQESGVTSVVSDMCMSFEARYSQAQEAAADRFAVDLLVASQGHAGGATDFFARLAEQRSNKRYHYLLASHPHPDNRIDKIREQIAAGAYPVLATEPLGADLMIPEKDAGEP